jgi:hypothetical protein
LIGEASALFEILSSRITNQKRCRQTMLALQEALVAKRQIEASYQGPADRRSAKLKLQPLRVFLCDQTWHLAAHDNKEDKVELFRLSGFQTVKVLNEGMTIPSTFSLRDYLGCAWSVQRGDRDYHVEIVFDAEAAPFIQERQWHRTQELEKQKDGSVIFRVGSHGELHTPLLGNDPTPQESAAVYPITSSGLAKGRTRPVTRHRRLNHAGGWEPRAERETTRRWQRRCCHPRQDAKAPTKRKTQERR